MQCISYFGWKLSYVQKQKDIPRSCEKKIKHGCNASEFCTQPAVVFRQNHITFCFKENKLISSAFVAQKFYSIHHMIENLDYFRYE